MSFTADVKDELTRVMPGCSHCDKAAVGGPRAHRGNVVFLRPAATVSK